MATVGSDGGTYDYSSVAAALTANETTIEIQGTWSAADTTTHTISAGAVLTTITATGSAATPRAVGASPTHWRHRPTSGHCWTLNSDCTFTALDIESQSTTTSDEIIRLNAANVDLIADKCLLGFNSANSQQDIVYNNNKTAVTTALTNCMIKNPGRSVMGHYGTAARDSDWDMNSCSCYNCGSQNEARAGIFGDTGAGTHTVNIFNSLLHVTGVSASTEQVIYHGGGTLTIAVDRCITNQSEIDNVAETDSLLSHNWTDDDTKVSDGDWVILQDITTAPYDFGLATNTFNEAEEMHSDSTGANLTMPSTDIEGTTRSAAYCCGAHEIGEGGAVTKTITTSLNAVLQKQAATITTSLNAVLQEAHTITTLLDAIVRAQNTQTTSLDATLKATDVTQTTSLDSTLKATDATQTTSLDSVIQSAGQTQTTSLDSVLKAAGIAQTTQLDATLKALGLTQTTSLDAILSGGAGTIATQLDAVLRKALSLSTSLDSVVRSNNTITTQIDSIIQAAATTTTSLDEIGRAHV